MQPDPQMFYKTFLELDKTNMLNIMSFDSKSMEILLNENFSDYYQSDFPVFYMNKQKNRQGKVKYRNAIDTALKNNQIGAVNKIIWYITNYQNQFVSSFLFINNFPKIMEKGILVKSLLDSNVFKMDFDNDQWPQSHRYDGKLIMPYNGSMFQLIDKYKETFGDELEKEEYFVSGNKMFKIKYTLNILPIIGEHFEVSDAAS